MSDKRFMELAIRKAEKGIRTGQTPFGACVVKKGRLISLAHNTVWKNLDITAHAEIVAIRQTCTKLKTVDLSGCAIYSTCEPCPMCFGACHWAGISKIIYGAEIRDASRLGFHELSLSSRKMKKWGRSPLRIKSRFMRSECLRLFDRWVKQKDKKTY